MKPSIEILEFPSNLRLIEPAPGKEPGVYKLTAWLKNHGFYEIVSPFHTECIHPTRYSVHLDQESNVRNAIAISDYALEQARV
jgi:hypothetical protein